MAEVKRKRGRPKGSGIDDAQILSQMAAMMLADPALTRTTALKALGIDNPSTQRRIRDKFAMEEKKLLSSARKSGVVPGKAVAKKAPAKKAAAKKAPAKKAAAKKAPAKKAPAKKAAAKKAVKKAPAKKAAAKKAPAKKAARKTAMKASGPAKSAAKKAPAKKAPRKAAAKTASTRRPAAKKAAAKKSGGKKASKARPGHFAPKASGPPGPQASPVEAKPTTAPGGMTSAEFTPAELTSAKLTAAKLTAAMNEAIKAGAPVASKMVKEMADLARANGKRAGVGSSIEAVVSNVVEQQIQLYEAAIKHSPVAALLRQQALVTDMMLTMLKAQKEWARSAK